jgi:hypothetical protein
MNAISKIAPFDAYAAYQRERDWSREVEKRLSKALMLLGIECDRRERRGEDVAHIRAFISEASA